jgi:hypothetical protein
VLMGVRLYQPDLGRFLTVNPVHGGSANDYDYCNADPVNCTDLDGRISWRSIAQRCGRARVVNVVGNAPLRVLRPLRVQCSGIPER